MEDKEGSGCVGDSFSECDVLPRGQRDCCINCSPGALRRVTQGRQEVHLGLLSWKSQAPICNTILQLVKQNAPFPGLHLLHPGPKGRIP